MPAMHLVVWLLVLFFAGTSARKEKTTATKRAPPSNFIQSVDGQFQVNGSEFKFVGANAYWLPTLNTDQDIRDTLANMSAVGINVVRVWGFNDVPTIPENGTWFQLIANGTTSVNTGPNGLQRLDTVIEIAESMGMYVLLSLTNNWNPLPLVDDLNVTLPLNPFDKRDRTFGTNNTLSRNILSNDYGGMDAYVREFGELHDDFYNQTIRDIFTNYTTQVVSRYVNRSGIFSWELANDPRCSSSLPSTPSCNTQTITNWHSIVAQNISAIDPNHLVSSGAHGFFCADCPKLFPFTPPAPPSPPPPQASAAARRKKRNTVAPLTKKQLLKEKAEVNKAKYLSSPFSRPGEGSVKIRGRWVAAPARRQDPGEVGVGPSFDGTEGVDGEDILNIPQIGFGTFQLFPDQNSYLSGFIDPTLPPFNATVQTGIQWIQRQASVAQMLGKPLALTGFGLVTQGNAPAFVPFNTSVAPFVNSQVTGIGNTSTAPFGITDQQRDDAYSQWLNASIIAGIQGIIVWQWGQANLTASPGTTISPVVSSTPQSPVVSETPQSPNDGYSLSGPGQDVVQGILHGGSQQITSGTPP